MMRFYLFLLAFLFSSAVMAEKIQVSCIEYQALSGHDLSCDTIPTLTIDSELYQKQKRAHKIKLCKQAVRAKYTTEECQIVPHVYHEGHEYRCYEEMLACEPAPSAPEKSSKKITLW